MSFALWPKKACPDYGRIRVILLIRGQRLYNVNIPIVADNLAELMSTDIKGVQVEMEVAGKKQTLFVAKDELQSNQAVSLEWDGKNSYGQILQNFHA